MQYKESTNCQQDDHTWEGLSSHGSTPLSTSRCSMHTQCMESDTESVSVFRNLQSVSENWCYIGVGGFSPDLMASPWARCRGNASKRLQMDNDPEEVRRPMAGWSLLGLLPDDFWVHRRAARRERLLSWRSLFDAAIERVDEIPSGTDPRRPRRHMPDAFWAHRRAAHREDLLAIRSIVDGFIHSLEEPAPAEPATRIDVS